MMLTTKISFSPLLFSPASSVNFNHTDLSPDAMFVLQQSKNVKKEKPCNKLSAVKKGKKCACLNRSQKQMDKTKEDYSSSTCVQVM